MTRSADGKITLGSQNLTHPRLSKAWRLEGGLAKASAKNQSCHIGQVGAKTQSCDRRHSLGKEILVQLAPGKSKHKSWPLNLKIPRPGGCQDSELWQETQFGQSKADSSWMGARGKPHKSWLPKLDIYPGEVDGCLGKALQCQDSELWQETQTRQSKAAIAGRKQEGSSTKVDPLNLSDIQEGWVPRLRAVTGDTN